MSLVLGIVGIVLFELLLAIVIGSLLALNSHPREQAVGVSQHLAAEKGRLRYSWLAEPSNIWPEQSGTVSM